MAAARIDVTLVKLGAVLIAVMVIGRLADYAFFLTDRGPPSLLIGGLVLQVFVPITIAWALWRFPNIVTRSLSPIESDEGATPISAKEAMQIGVSLLGLYTLVFGVIDLLYFEAYRYAEREITILASFPDRVISPQQLAGRITNIAQILLGCILIVGRKRIVDLLRAARGPRPRAS